MALLVQLQKGRILSELGYLKGSVTESYGLVCPVFVRGTESKGEHRIKNHEIHVGGL